MGWVAASAACGGVLGAAAATRIGLGFMAVFGVVFGACIGVALSPVLVLMFRRSDRSLAIGVALPCALIAIALTPWPQEIGPALANAVIAWVGSMVMVRVMLARIGRTRPAPGGVMAGCALGIIAISTGAFWIAYAVRSWPRATDPASALEVVERAYRSNEMTVHELGHEALVLISERDADRLSRDPDARVRHNVARGLTDAQQDAFARATLERLAGDSDRYVRSEALWSMVRRWPNEVDAVTARMRADPDPSIRDDADDAARMVGR